MADTQAPLSTAAVAIAGADDQAAPCVTASKIALRGSPLRIGVSTRALFDLEDEHAVFLENGVVAYANLQQTRENVPLMKGPAFAVVQHLLRLNEPGERPFVEVVLLSRSSPDQALRAFATAQRHGLAICAGSFTSGQPLGPLVAAWDIDLFFCNEVDDVRAAATGGAAAARLGRMPPKLESGQSGELRIALDGDAVVFSAESDLVFAEQGLDAFLRHERDNAQRPMMAGPFGSVLRKLSLLRQSCRSGCHGIRIALVTARSAPAHERVVKTLRAWGTPVDEAHFMGGRSKAAVLQAFGAHIFFDDQEKHVREAADMVVTGHVPGPHDPQMPIIPG